MCDLTKRQPMHWSVVAMVFVLIAVTYGSLVPFLPPDRNLSIPTTFWDVFRLPLGELSRREVPVHFASFAPVGLLASWILIGRIRRRAIVIAIVLTSGFAFMLEVLQGLSQTRHASWLDVLVNTLAGGVGAIYGLPVRRARRDKWRAQLVTRERAAAILLLTVGNIVLIAVLVRVHSGATLANWNPGYNLSIANEATGDRPWDGVIAGLAIYDWALPDDVVAERARQSFSSSAARPDALVVFDFGRQPPDALRIRSHAGANMALTVAVAGDVSFGTNGLRFAGESMVRTETPPKFLYDAILTSNAFTIETMLLPASMNQEGPARIITMSADPFLRNITIAQSGPELDIRIRTPRTGNNGYLIPMRTTGLALDGGWHHVAVVYDNGVVHLHVDGAPPSIEIDLATPSMMVFRRQWYGSDALVAAMLFTPLAMIAAVPWVDRRGRLAVLFGVFATCVLPIAAFALAAMFHDRAVDWSFVIAAVAMSATGVMIGRALHPSRPIAASVSVHASSDTAT